MSVTNRVYKAKMYPLPDLDKIQAPNYSPPTSRFSAGVLRGCPGTLLLFSTGSVVINGCKSDNDANKSVVHCAMETGYLITDLTVVNIVGCYKLDRRLDLPQVYKDTPGSILEPEIHCGLLFYIGKVSVIVYHTGTIMFAGCKSDAHFETVVDFIREKFNKY